MSTLQAKIKTLFKPFLTRPWYSPAMEFRYGMWNGVSALMTEGGRQLGEESTRPLIFNRHIASDIVECRYEGSRLGKPINASALRFAMSHFDEALDIVGLVRNYHLKKTGRTHTDVPGIWDLYIISRASVAMIAYQIRSQPTQAAEPIIPQATASMYQFISGVFMICRHMMDRAYPAIATNATMSSDDLYAYADNNGIFFSPNGMVCAGSKSRIIEFLEFCNTGNRQVRSANSERQINPLDSYVSSPDDWYHYAILSVEFDCFIELEITRLKGQATALSHNVLDQIRAIYQSLGAYALAPLNDHKPYLDGPFADGALARQNVILALLNMPPIKVIPERYIKERMSF